MSSAASLRRVAATIALTLTIGLFGSSLAQAACQNSLNFSGVPVGGTVRLDVSSCGPAILSGLYSVSSGDSNQLYPMNSPYVNSSSTSAPQVITTASGAQFRVTPQNDAANGFGNNNGNLCAPPGYFYNFYDFTLLAVGSSSSTTMNVYYGSTNDNTAGACHFNQIDTAYPISFTNVGTNGPTVTSISPTSGPTGGGTSVVITGTNFVGVTAVRFGATNATGFTVVSPTQISATAPAGAAGTVDVTVTAGGSTSATSAADRYTYVTPTSPPTISIAFGTGSIPVGGSTSLSFTINNPNAAASLTGITFSNNLPSGLIVATPNGASGSCGGTLSATAGSGSISLSGGTLAASASCTISVNVKATSVGVKSNTTGVVGSTEGGNGTTSNTASLTVTQGSTTTAVATSSNPSTFGQPVTFTATVSAVAPATGTPTGNVTFTVDGANQATVALNGSGQATFTSSTLAGGSHTITASYTGDSSFSSSVSGSLTQTVNKGGTTTAVSSGTNPSTSGQPVTFTATVAAVAPATGTPTGNVTFNVDGVNQAPVALNGSGQATFTSSTLAGGSHTITASYAGDSSFNTSTSPGLTQTVNKGGTTTTVTSGTNPSTSGQNVTFTATVAAVSPATGTPTGNVTFNVDGVNQAPVALNGSGQATFSSSTLAGGSHTITASYAGDSSFNASTSAGLTQTVNKGGTTTAVTSGTNPSISGQGVTFTATVTAVAPATGTPTGNVTFNVDGVNQAPVAINGSGQATFTSSTLTSGSHTITASYAGDSNFNSSTSAGLTQTVNKGGTTSAISSATNPSTFGQNVTFTATVAAVAPATGTPTGTMTFNGASGAPVTVPLSGGSATFSTSTLALGPHSVTVTYNGDANFNTSSSAALTQTVNAAGNTITFNKPPDTPFTSTPPTLNATATSGVAPTYASNSGPVCTVTSAGVITFISAGVCSITASQGATGNYAAATPVTQTFNVTAGVNTITFNKPADTPFTSPPPVLNATATSGVAPTYTSNSGPVCTVTSAGAITFVSAGVCSITASQGATGNYGAATPVTQTFNVTAGVNTITFNKPADTAFTSPPPTLNATATSGVAPTYTSNSGPVCTVTSAGAITFVSAGVCSITASQGATGNYGAATPVTQTFNVTAGVNTITFNKPADTPFTSPPPTLNATATSGVTPTYASNSAPVCTVTSAGAITFVAAGTCSITASQGATGNYAAATPVTQTFNVTAGVNTIAFTTSPPASPMVAGTYTPTASATSNLPVALTIDPSSAAVCAIAGGVVSFNNVGTCTINANQPGNANYAAATQVQQSFVIAVGTVSIALTATPNFVVFGSPLTMTATITIPGAGPGAAPITGTVAFKDGAATLGSSPVSGGVATFVTSSLATGAHKLQATYSGNGAYASVTTAVVTITVSPPSPVASSFSVAVPYLSPGFAIDLAAHTTGVVTSYVLASAPTKGTAVLSGSTVTYVPARGYSGPDSFTYKATGPGGTSAAATVSIGVAARPDPSQDPSVAGLVNAQVASAQRMAQSQMSNVERRLDQLHEDEQEPISMGMSFAATEPQLGRDQQALQELRRLWTNDPDPTRGGVGRTGTGRDGLGGQNRRYLSSFDDNPRKTSSSSAGSSRFNIWTAGNVTWGSQNYTTLGGGVFQTGNRFATSGVTIGIDTRLFDGFKAGVAFGYGGDSTRVGFDGTHNQARFFSATAYGSLKLMPQTFLDVLLGYGRGSFTSTRFSTPGGVYLGGSRSADVFYGSLSLTYEQKWGALKLASYGRLGATLMNFGAYSEYGSDIWALSYGAMKSNNLTGVIGARLSYTFETDYGRLSPQVRVEYRHAFGGGYNQILNYADQPGGQMYAVSGLSQATNAVNASLGLKFEDDYLLAIGIEYQIGMALGIGNQGGLQAGGLRFSLKQGF
ncbi:MAG: hypothetical protein BGP04_01380 [Rhizobiales bacterium 62-17]|nr:Ig-like domain repeat protein [Hyphomicrobiales bacterium]OJY04108.1 MAG: hypothetical protein BGP04_01380 [Rhizobiales bacterium 62-17]